MLHQHLWEINQDLAQACLDAMSCEQAFFSAPSLGSQGSNAIGERCVGEPQAQFGGRVGVNSSRPLPGVNWVIRRRFAPAYRPE